MPHKPVFPVFMLVLCATASALCAADWPEFRGPRGDGTVEGALPVRWSETENVRWKTAIPFKGWSTPVVMDGRVWLTTATEDGHEFYGICLDAESGAILFNEKLFSCDNPEPLGNEVNCYASPSPVIEPGRVFLHFGSYGTACLDTATFKTLWTRTDLPCRHFRGPGSSPIMFENLLILTFDGADVQYSAALEKETGKTVWRTDRTSNWKDLDENGQPQREGDFRKSFCTPFVIDAAGHRQLITTSSYSVFSYDVRTGAELWKIDHEAYSPAPRPVFGNGLVHVITGRGKNAVLAVRPDGSGDVSATHVAWKAEGKLVPLEPSPLLLDGLLYLLSNDGTLTCLDAASGTEVWSARIGGSYVSSPVHADGLIYCFSTNGKTTVIKAGRTYGEVAENRLDEGFMASPAVIGNDFILRTKTHLYRIGNTAK